MRILIVSQWCDPEPNIKSIAFAKELMSRGHEVQVLTGFPNYPGGQIYPGYRIRLYQHEQLQGVPVLRVPLFPSHDRSAVRRVANYASFAASAASIGVAGIGGADVAFVYHPPGTVGLPAMALRLFRGVPFVYDIQDLWPEALQLSGMLQSPSILRIVDLWCRLTYRAASHVTVLSPGFRELLIQRGIPPRKIEVVYNWCDDELFRPLPPDSILAAKEGMADRFNVVFAGTMGTAQGLENILEAAALLRDESKIQFVLFGGGTEVDRLELMARERRLDNVVFKGRRPSSDMPALFAISDVLLVHLRSEPIFDTWIPSKTQAYLASGRPIITNVPGDAAKLVTQSDAGLAIPPEDPDALARAILRIHAMPRETREQMGARGAEYYQAHLSRAIGIDKYLRVFEKVRRS